MSNQLQAVASSISRSKGDSKNVRNAIHFLFQGNVYFWKVVKATFYITFKRNFVVSISKMLYELPFLEVYQSQIPSLKFPEIEQELY